jgi:hypothetical protein
MRCSRHHPFAVPRRRCGFTLIELLVLAALIGLLLALLMPGLLKARRAAEVAHCFSKLQHLGIATMAYTHDFKGFMPPGAYDEGPGAMGWPNVTTLGPEAYYHGYLPLTSAWDGPFMCPTYQHDGIEPRAQNTAAAFLKVSYTYNLKAGGYYFIDRWVYPPIKVSQLRDPAGSAYLIDGIYRTPTKTWYALHSTPLLAPQPTFANFAPMDRHPGQANHLLHVDGHANAMTGADFAARKDEVWLPR